MITTAKTKQLVLFALVYALVIVNVCVLALYTIRNTQAAYETLRTEYHEKQAAVQSAQSIEQTLALSADDRDELATYFLSERDVITLLAHVEQTGRASRLAIETTQLAVNPKTEKEQSQLKVGFEYEGAFADVIMFTQWLETLPYHKAVADVALSEEGRGIWKGQMSLSVTILP